MEDHERRYYAAYKAAVRALRSEPYRAYGWVADEAAVLNKWTRDRF